MSAKSWDDLLWRHLMGQLDPDEQRDFARYLRECAPCRDELAEWERLQGAVKSEVRGRLDGLPPLPTQFFDRLDQHAVSRNGARSPYTYREDVQTMTTIAINQRPASNPTRRLQVPTLALAAAFATVLLIVALLVVASGTNDTPPDDPLPGAGINGIEDRDDDAENLQSATPSFTPTATHTWTPSPTITPSSTPIPSAMPTIPHPGGSPTRVPIDPSAGAPTLVPGGTGNPAHTQATPIGPLPSPTRLNPQFTGTLVPTVPPPPPGFSGASDPRASITPSLIEPIIAAPATLIAAAELPGDDFSFGIAWSPEGDRLGAAGYSGVWVYERGNLAGSVQLLPDLSGRGMLSLGFSPDGAYIASMDWMNTLVLWDAKTGARLTEVRDAPLWDTPMFLEDGETIIANRSYGTLTLIEGDGAPPTLSIGNLPGSVSAGTLLPGTDANTVIAIIENGTVSTVDISTGEVLNGWRIEPSSFIIRAAVTADRSTIALANSDGTVQVVDMADGALIGQQQYEGVPYALDFLADGRLVTSVRTNTLSSVWLWDPATDVQSAIYVHDVAINDLAVNPVDDSVALMSADGRLSLLEIE